MQIWAGHDCFDFYVTLCVCVCVCDACIWICCSHVKMCVYAFTLVCRSPRLSFCSSRVTLYLIQWGRNLQLNPELAVMTSCLCPLSDGISGRLRLLLSVCVSSGDPDPSSCACWVFSKCFILHLPSPGCELYFLLLMFCPGDRTILRIRYERIYGKVHVLST